MEQYPVTQESGLPTYFAYLIVQACPLLLKTLNKSFPFLDYFLLLVTRAMLFSKYESKDIGKILKHGVCLDYKLLLAYLGCGISASLLTLL